MRGARAGGWIAGTIVLILALGAATWFLVAGPVFARAAETQFLAADQQAQNDLLVLQNAQLAQDFDKLDQHRAALAAAQAQIPPSGQIVVYLRTVEALATASGVDVVQLSPGIPQTVVPAIAPAPVEPATDPAAEDPADGEDSEGTEQEDAAEDVGGTAGATDGATGVDPLAPAVPEGFIAVPVTIKVVGPFANATSFLRLLQTGTERLTLVTGLDGTRQVAAEASGGRPAVADGDIELTVSGFIFTLLDPAQEVPVPADGEVPAPTPLPTTDRNPFVPLG